MISPPTVTAGNCPACKRFIGRIAVCPYCDVDIPVPPQSRLIRLGALALATGGLLLFWLVAAIGPSTDGFSSNAYFLGHAEGGTSCLANAAERLQAVIGPHFHWILWGGIVLMLLAEPPQPVLPGKAGWRRCLAANAPTAMAALVFLLAGLLGFILWRTAFQSPAIILLTLLPAVGIAALPSLYGVRHIHWLGAILLPLAFELSGLAPTLAVMLRLC